MKIERILEQREPAFGVGAYLSFVRLRGDIGNPAASQGGGEGRDSTVA